MLALLVLVGWRTHTVLISTGREPLRDFASAGDSCCILLSSPLGDAQHEPRCMGSTSKIANSFSAPVAQPFLQPDWFGWKWCPSSKRLRRILIPRGVSRNPPPRQHVNLCTLWRWCNVRINPRTVLGNNRVGVVTQSAFINHKILPFLLQLRRHHHTRYCSEQRSHGT